MGAAQEALVEPLVWISEVGPRDTAAARLNQRKVRQQAKRYHVALRERERLDQPASFEFVNGFQESFQSRSDSVHRAGVTESLGEGPRDGGQPPSKNERRASKVDTSARRRLLRLQAMALKLHHIAEGGYTAARIEYNFDLLDLSTFTSAHMGRTAAASLHENKSAMQGYLRTRDESFLEFVPKLYTESLLLRTVVDCVLSQAQRTLCQNPKVPQAEVYTLYQKAIHGLQEALNDESTAFDSDVLCSVQLMQLFEVRAPQILYRCNSQKEKGDY